MAARMGNVGQVLDALIDTNTNTLRVSIENVPVTIDVSAITDSIKIADASGVAATITDVAGKKSLDVNVTDVSLSHTNDSVRLGDGGSNLATVTATGALKVDGSGVTQPVSGTFYQATQPVSLASAPTTPVTGTFWQATQPVSLASAPTTPVTGTFWQATQPVSGTFFQATQPVSLASAPTTPVTGTFWQATQPVSGTFFQATQPVSIASMPSTPVTGTFWQATQPVSGTVTANAGSGTMAVSGTFWQATQPVSGTVTANAGTGTMAISNANLDAAISTRLKPADTLTAVTTVGTITNPVAATQSGTWTVQPGNTPNTTPWLVTASLGNATGKTNVMKTGSLASSATTADQVILTYTVTAGKTFYLEYFDVAVRLTTYAATATNFGNFSLESAAGTKLYTSNIFHAGATGPAQIFFSEPVPIGAGVVVRLVCTPSATTAFTWTGNFGGYEK